MRPAGYCCLLLLALFATLKIAVPCTHHTNREEFGRWKDERFLGRNVCIRVSQVSQQSSPSICLCCFLCTKDKMLTPQQRRRDMRWASGERNFRESLEKDETRKRKSREEGECRCRGNNEVLMIPVGKIGHCCNKCREDTARKNGCYHNTTDLTPVWRTVLCTCKAYWFIGTCRCNSENQRQKWQVPG